MFRSAFLLTVAAAIGLAAPAGAEVLWHCQVPGYARSTLVSPDYAITLSGGGLARVSDRLSRHVTGADSVEARIQRNDAQMIRVVWSVARVRTKELKLPWESLYTTVIWRAEIAKPSGAMTLEGTLTGRDAYIFVRGRCERQDGS